MSPALKNLWRESVGRQPGRQTFLLSDTLAVTAEVLNKQRGLPDCPYILKAAPVW